MRAFPGTGAGLAAWEVRPLAADDLAADGDSLAGDGLAVDDGPLDWPGYGATRTKARDATGHDEAVTVGTARVAGREVVVIAFQFGYVGGSVGRDAGDRICGALRYARRHRLPVVSLLSTGGSRIQEGTWSLRQLPRIAAECARNRIEGIAHVSVATHPTTGGIWATLGAGADVVVGIRHAAVAFAGRRVRGDSDDTTDFLSDGKYRTGQVDMLVDPADLAGVLADLVDLFGAAEDRRGDRTPAPVPRALGATSTPADGWTAVQRARDVRRPRADAYLDDYFDLRVPLSGDRAGGTDAGMLCGIGRREGRVIAYAAQAGTATTPAGLRTAARLVALADRLGIPVLTLVDTPGAADDATAERAGVGPAIASLYTAIAAATVPVTTLVIGEGGSGGALALASPDHLWVTADAYVSVIAPHAAAATLKLDPSSAPELADRLRLRPQDLLADGLAQGIAGPEPVTL